MTDSDHGLSHQSHSGMVYGSDSLLVLKNKQPHLPTKPSLIVGYLKGSYFLFFAVQSEFKFMPKFKCTFI